LFFEELPDWFEVKFDDGDGIFELELLEHGRMEDTDGTNLLFL